MVLLIYHFYVLKQTHINSNYTVTLFDADKAECFF